jgi:DNA topoisomerase-1
MEEDLDKISNGEKQSIPYLKDFYFGNKEHSGLTALITQEIDARDICTIPVVPGENTLNVRIGRFGPYLEKGEKKAPLPEETAPADLTMEKAEEILNTAKPAGDEIGTDKKTGLKIWKKVGRFGPYLQMGEKGEEGAKMKSIPKFINPDELTMEQAEEILSWPKSLGKMSTGSEIIFDIGPYGPYLKYDGKNKAIPAGHDITNLNLEEAEKIWTSATGKGAGKSAPGARQAAAPLKDFGNGLVVKTGRYGAYVTDGKTNASIPKNMDIENMTSDQAMELIKNKQK